MGSEIPKPNHLKSRQMGTTWSKTIWNPDKKDPDFEWSNFGMVGTIAIALDQPFDNMII